MSSHSNESPQPPPVAAAPATSTTPEIEHYTRQTTPPTIGDQDAASTAPTIASIIVNANNPSTSSVPVSRAASAYVSTSPESNASTSPANLIQPAQLQQPPNSFRQQDTSSSNTVSGLLMETSHHHHHHHQQPQLPSQPQQPPQRLSPQSQTNLASGVVGGGGGGAGGDSRLSISVEPNRSEFGISAATEPILESNPPSFVSQNLSSDIFMNQLNREFYTSVNTIPEKKSTVSKIASDLIELQKNNRLQGSYYYSNTMNNNSSSTVNYVNPSFQSSINSTAGLGAIGSNQQFSFLSEIESAILRSIHPIELNEYEEITVNGERGIWANRAEVAQWRGQIPIIEYPINEDACPEVVTKRTQQTLDYTQEIAIRYLRPPTPPIPGDIIIQQIDSQAIPPAPPIIIRQQPARPRTPEPLVIREAPPIAPIPIGRKVITISGKRVPPPPRKVIIERLAPIPPKPQSVIIERWLPYSQVKRKVIFNKANEKDPIVVKPRNIIVQWEAPQVQIKREFKYLGVIRANPEEYRNRYKSILITSKDLPQFVLDIPTPKDLVLAANYKQPQPIYELEGDLNAFRLFNLESVGLGEYRSYLQRLGVLSDQPSQQLSQQPLQHTQTLPFSYTPTQVVNTPHNNLAPPPQQPPPPPVVSSYQPPLLPNLSFQQPHQPQQQQYHHQQSPQQVATNSSSRSLFDDLLQESADEVIQHIFKSIDTNNTGRIRIEDAERTFLKMNTRLDRRYGEADVNAFFNALDINRDRTIDYGEFKRAFLNLAN